MIDRICGNCHFGSRTAVSRATIICMYGTIDKMGGEERDRNYWYKKGCSLHQTENEWTIGESYDDYVILREKNNSKGVG